MIEDWLAQGLSRAEVVERLVQAFGLSPVEAEFRVAVELGEVPGNDLVVEDEDGRD